MVTFGNTKNNNMDNKTWIEANLEGKVKARALRACDEQSDWFPTIVKSVADCFVWTSTKEDEKYWFAIYDNETNPDQWLHEDYVDVDQTPIEEAAQQALRKIEQAKKVNHIVEPTEMVEDKFLEWLEGEIEFTRENGGMDRELWAFSIVIEKYNELKNK